MIIKKSTLSDLNKLLDAEKQAFGSDEGPVIVELVKGLLIDPTAKPILSLIAVNDDQIVGHILFTKVRITANEHISSSILAPLAVIPGSQGQGVGGKLIREGLRLLIESGIELVFVLGHPGYYPRYGFKPAGPLGFEAPYPIPDEVADAWMVYELVPDLAGRVGGKIICADVLNRPEYWRE